MNKDKASTQREYPVLWSTKHVYRTKMILISLKRFSDAFSKTIWCDAKAFFK